MEILKFECQSSPLVLQDQMSLCGVVGSGNLEILMQRKIHQDHDSHICTIEVKTSARGFGQIWEAVLNDFCHAHAVGGVRISINDMGATPAVVSLRLSQALGELRGAIAS